MKHLIILGDGMADWPVPSLADKTLLQYADTPAMDWLARNGRCGMLKTVPDGFHPGSEVANSSILGYDQHRVYEGRGPLEAASIGIELEPGDLALRCNLVCIEGDMLKNHSCGRLETEEGDVLIRYLNEHLATDRVHFYTGVQYRHLLVIKGGDKRLRCTPPHDIPLQTWRDKIPSAESVSDGSPVGIPRSGALPPLSAEQTATLLCDLILRSQELLPQHSLNKERAREGKDMASSIWPWGGGYRPQMQTLAQRFSSQVHRGAVITAVDLIRGIGRYAGLDVINVPGATGLYDTNFEGKAQAAIDAFRSGYDFVYLHVEAADEAGHDGSVPLKLQTIEDLDHRLIQPILASLGIAASQRNEELHFVRNEELQPTAAELPQGGGIQITREEITKESASNKSYSDSAAASRNSTQSAILHSAAESHNSNSDSAAASRNSARSAILHSATAGRNSTPLSIALLPDHPTPCAHRTHTAEPIPFAIWYPGIEPDSVQTFDEVACREGSFGFIEGDEFIRLFMETPSSLPLKGEGGHLQP